MTKKKKDNDQVTISRKDLDRLMEGGDKILELQGRIEELEKANEEQKERHAEELEEARKFLYLPTAIRVERVGRRTKFYDELSGLQLYGFSKSKIDAPDNKPATVTLTVEAELRHMAFVNEQLSLLDGGGEGEGVEGATGDESQADTQAEAIAN